MIKSGVCSVTFREKTPEEIIALGVEAGLDGIEWGADVHVLHGDVETAERVGRLTREAGLEVASYGSYYFAFDKPGDPFADYTPVLDSAEALGAPVIRIWPGSFHVESSPAYFQSVVHQTRSLATAAAERGMKIAFEFHPNTLTETLDGALELIWEVGHANVYSYWQPPNNTRLEQRKEQLVMLKNRLLYLHVFHWENSPEPPYIRLPLAAGASEWMDCFAIAENPDREQYALLEFVRDDDPEQFLQDVATLKSWLAGS